MSSRSLLAWWSLLPLASRPELAAGGRGCPASGGGRAAAAAGCG
ncbi:hypothetical protein [Rhodococcus pyridinivorans]|nr:hypothetical protein [Rhodococcus pyridinivorans]WAL49669.1 hypothetical protein OQN32_27030 [Rhodococcus pyridinivorans]